MFLQRLLHREIQAVFLLITRHIEIALSLFALFFFPGVLLHEFSHYVVALLLGVPVGRFSLVPQVLPAQADRPAGKPARLQLGFVETSSTDILRDALIGTAPLVFGGLFITYAGLVQLGLDQLWNGFLYGGKEVMIQNLEIVHARPDFWLWFYLIFAVSSTMMPSASDRRAWIPIILAISLLLALSLLVGAGPWLEVHVAPPFNQALRALSVVMGISAGVHVVLLIPVYGLRILLNRLTGLEVA
ncbi:MAG: hypothetical protein ACM3PY_22425 [Omnitrophica WOR_2 bacterium]